MGGRESTRLRRGVAAAMFNERSRLESVEVHELRQFRALFCERDDAVGSNHAVPRDGVSLDERGIDGLSHFYASRARQPACTYLIDLAPGVEDRLTRSGYE